MKNTSNEITFTYYNDSLYILHTLEGRHFIINKSKKEEIEKILNCNDIELKNKLINKIKNFKSEDNKYMFLSDFQFKKAIITENNMEILSRPFIFLFENFFLYFFFFIIVFVPKETN